MEELSHALDTARDLIPIGASFLLTAVVLFVASKLFRAVKEVLKVRVSSPQQ